MKDKISSKLRILYFCALFGLLPLFFTNYYYNITISKAIFFMITTALTFLGQLILVHKFPYKNIPGMLPLSIFLGAALISTLCSSYPLSAFTGNQGRYMGFLMILFLAVSFYLFASSENSFETCYPALYISGSIVALFAILQFISLDPLRLSEHVPKLYIGTFLSTIGQINVLSGYLAMFTAFCLTIWCIKGSWYLLLSVGLGFTGLFVTNSDTGFVSTFIVVLLLPIFLKNKVSFLRYFGSLILFCGCIGIAFVLEFFGIVPYEGVSSLLSTPLYCILGILVFACFAVLIDTFLKTEKQFDFLKRIYKWSLFLFVVLALLLMIANGMFPLADKWGSFRGYIWKKLVYVYSYLSPLDKLIGYGPDTLEPLLKTGYMTEIIKMTGKSYNNAHNDFLQYLLTTGIIGAASWLIFWINIIRNSIKSMSDCLLPWFAVIIAYLIQAMLVPTFPLTASLGFAAAGICAGIIKKER